MHIDHPASAAALAELLSALADDDLAELACLSQGNPIRALLRVLDRSTYSFCARDDRNHVVFVGGVMLDDPPYLWMMAAAGAVARDKKGFLRTTRAELGEILSRWPTLQCAVDDRWVKSLRWLKWLGFVKVGDREAFGRHGSLMEISRRCPNLS